MNADHQPWSIHLQAKAKNFDFKFKATRFFPACYNIFQFSLFLKISSLIIRLSSDNNNNQPTTRNSFKSKIKRFIDRFRSISTKRKMLPAHSSSRIKKSRWISSEGPICGSTVLIQSIYEKDIKGMVVHCLSLLLYIFTLLRTSMRIKNNKLMLVSVLLMVGYPLWFYMKNN